MSKATVFEKIAASVPQNATAATVVSQRGEHYEPKIKTGHDHRDVQPKTRPIPAGQNNCAELVGRRFGRLTVIGLAAEQGTKNKNARWVVRCQCGHYEFRKAKAIRNPANAKDMCQHCHHLEHIKWLYKNHGGMSLEELAERSRDVLPAAKPKQEALL